MGIFKASQKGDLDITAQPIIEQLLLSDPKAIEQTKRRALLESGLILNDDKFNELVIEHSKKRMSEEANEGLNSFLEKRTAYWYKK